MKNFATNLLYFFQHDIIHHKENQQEIKIITPEWDFKLNSQIFYVFHVKIP